MKIKEKLKELLLILFILLLFAYPAKADVGSFDSYDSGDSGWSSSDSDWGSSSSDWGHSSSDWGSSDWDYSYSGSGSSTGSGDIFLGMIILVSIFIIFVSVSRNANKNKYNSNPNYQAGNEFRPTTVYTTNVHDVPQTHVYAVKIKAIDPMFSEEKFLAWAKDLYVKLQHAWTEREWEEMRPFETEELFEQHSAQIQEYIKNNTINVVDRIAVNYATIYGFRQTEDKDIVEVALKATKKDYIINATTREVVEGNRDQYRITVYKMTFERTKGKLTEAGKEDLDARNCPNCGAPLNITSAGRCEYCGSIVTTGVHDWVLSGLEPLRKEY